jgi:hypothetical protein
MVLKKKPLEKSFNQINNNINRSILASIKIIISIIIFTFGISFFKVIRIKFMQYYYAVTATIKRMHRLLNVDKRSEIVWLELIKLHKAKKWNFGQFDKEKYIQTFFNIEDNVTKKFIYQIHENKLEFQALVLNSFDEEITSDILILASHFNGLLQFGKVSVSVKHNYVEFTYSGDLLTYLLFTGEIYSDLDTHYKITKDCCWAFLNLIETGEDPVFVFSEFLKRIEGDDKTIE